MIRWAIITDFIFDFIDVTNSDNQWLKILYLNLWFWFISASLSLSILSN